MKKQGIILLIVTIILAGFWVWNILAIFQEPKSNTVKEQLASQSDEKGDVVVKVTPVTLEPGKEVRFRIALDTHNVELNYDLLKLSNLSDDKGNNLKPLSWTGGSGGHHLSGELIFPSLSAKAKSARLTIAAISGIDREFIWSL